MTTTQEIKARVAQADRARIERRGEAAAAVFDLAQRRDQLRAELVRTEQQLATAVTAATALMTIQELSSFIGRQVRDVNRWAAAAAAKRGRGAVRQPGSGVVAVRAGRPASANVDEISNRPASSAGDAGIITTAPPVSGISTPENIVSG